MEKSEKGCVLGILSVDKHVENVDFRGESHSQYSATSDGLCTNADVYGIKFYKSAQDLLVWKHFFCYTEIMDNQESCAIAHGQEKFNV